MALGEEIGARIDAAAARDCLIAAAREREFISRLAQRFLIALVFVVATVGGIMSKTGNLGGTVDVVAGLMAFALGMICAFCGARLAYLNAEQV